MFLQRRLVRQRNQYQALNTVLRSVLYGVSDIAKWSTFAGEVRLNTHRSTRLLLSHHKMSENYM